MPIRAEDLDFDTARALLDFQVAMGATEAVGEVPRNRFLAPAEAPSAAAPPASPAAVAPAVGPERAISPVAPSAAAADPVAEAKASAAAATSLDELREAMQAYDRCELKRGARQLVFADGNPAARVMIVGEAPGRDEDRIGRPFVGQAGQLLDRMLAAIGLDRTSPDPARAVYITNVLPWRPPENRDPTPDEVAMMRPFLLRHIELADPQVLVVMGNHSAQALLGQRGITRLRGHWQQALGRPALPMFHPAYLLRQPAEKRKAWADLLELRARLDE